MKFKTQIRKISLNRIFITGILILIQVVWFLFFFFHVINYSAYIGTALTILSLPIMLYIVNKDINPSYKISWLLLIATLPILGGLLYVFFGGKRPAKAMANKLRESQEVYLTPLSQDKEVFGSLEKENKRFSTTCRYVCDTCGYPVYDGGLVQYFSLGDDMYPVLIEELKKAKHSIFLEFFIIANGIMWDSILEILVEKAKSGVDVRIIYDDMGCVALLPKGYNKYLESLDPNIKCIVFNPVVPFFSVVMNNRDHRKIVVIDSSTAFNGGINLSDEYINAEVKYGKWKDTGVMVKGPAVYSFTEMFLEMWNAFRKENDDIENYRPEPADFTEKPAGYVLPLSDTPLDNEPLGEEVYLEIINQAKDYVYILTPYLVIDDDMKSALTLAAKRGVDVRIVTPGIPDKKVIYRLTRANYVPLMCAGVRIFEYTPGFVHAKSYISDDKIGIVGTINMDYRSLYLHFECGTLMYDTPCLKDLKADSLSVMEDSHEITLSNFKQYYKGTMFDAFLRVIAPLL